MAKFHAGELEMQERAGVRGMAERVGGSIRTEVPPAAQEFLLAQPFVVLGGKGAEGLVWASLLSGEPGFAHSVNERTVRLEAALPEGDPLKESFENGAPVGMIAIEPTTRRRMRLNGLAQSDQSGITIQTQQVYGNCPKYIQKRHWHREEHNSPGELRRNTEMHSEQIAFIAQADTFFIASTAQGSCDASHRGGTPGFVKVLDATTLRFPDYTGNAMFNTLGNLLCDERAGLLFPNWSSATTLQLAGRARVLWGDEAAAWPDAERAVEFRIEHVWERPHANSLRWQFIEASPFNLPL